MKKIIIIFTFIIVVCVNGNAQIDYNARGLRHVSRGEYVEAKMQFEAQLSVLKSQKVNENSDEYIKVQKMISYAEECIGYSNTANQILSELNESSLQQSFTKCTNEEDAERIKNNYLAKLETAKKALERILQRFVDDKVAKTNLQKCAIIEKQVEGFRNNLNEILAWRALGSNPGEDDLLEFLDSYPDGSYASAAKSALTEIRDERMWAATKQSGTLSAYKEYLASFKDGKHAEEAVSTVDKMGEELAWAEAKELGNSARYQEFIEEYPSSTHISTAKEYLAQCLDMEYWREQSAKNTISGFKNYLEKYPQGQFVKDAQNGIDKINDQAEWGKAVAANTVKAYQDYLSNSKYKAFKSEAERKIAEIKHAQEVAADEDLWVRIKNSKDRTDFLRYLNSSAYKGHKDEATGYSNLLYARDLEMTTLTASDIVKYYDRAKQNVSLERIDQIRYRDAQELVAYNKFNSNRSIKSGLAYLSSFPNGKNSNEVSDYVARAKADNMTKYVTQDIYEEALAYAKTDDAKKYVASTYSAKQREYKQYERKLRTERVHFLFGVDGMYHLDQIYEAGAVISIGGHSNRFNLEAGYNYMLSGDESALLSNGVVYVRPKINIVKKNYKGLIGSNSRRGRDYSKFYFYIAPEVCYFVDQYIPVSSTKIGGFLDYVDYGARVGVGISWFDLSAAYLVNINSISFGITVYFGNK